MDIISDMYLASLSASLSLGGHLSVPRGERWELFPPLKNTQNKFYLITKGSCTITVEGEEYHGRPGDLFLIPAGVSHSYKNHSEAEFSKLWVHFDLLPDNTVISLLSLPIVLQVPKEGKAYRLLRRFVRLKASQELADRIEAKALILDLFAEYVRLSYPAGVEVRTEQKTPIGEIVRYINNHLKEPLTVASLAERCYLHPNHFTRIFKQKTGQTPARYIRGKKMELAKTYLEGSDLSIREIMEKVGEEDLFGFSKRFKSYSSYSPREYRRLTRKG